MSQQPSRSAPKKPPFEKVGKYQMLDLIGAGAMGEVYRAHDPVLKRHVAVKMLSQVRASDPDVVRRFQREAQSAARLNHPNIVTVFDFGEESGRFYMTMELLQGRDLKDVIVSQPNMPLLEKLGILEQVCAGLAFAHAAGVVHRDLKPANIHLQPDGRVKIVDFGLARFGGSEMTQAGMVMGTPNYMSPEQVRGERADARSDIFALGAVMYEVLSSRRAFAAPVMHEILARVLEFEPEPLGPPEYPAALGQVVARAMRKPAEQRYQKADEVGEALREVRQSLEAEASRSTVVWDAPPTVVTEAPTLGGVAPVAAPSSPARSRASLLPRPIEARPRGRLWAGLAGAGLLVAALVAGGLWLARRGGEEGPSADATTAAERTQAQLGILKDTLVESQVELARIDLANKDYATAIERSQQALELDPAHVGARETLERARTAQRDLELAAAEARAAYQKGDLAAASAALGSVLALNPAHPVAVELSQALNQQFRGQAEGARRAMLQAREVAQRSGAASRPAFAEARTAAGQADALLGREQFAEATRRFFEARDAFARAEREAQAEAAARAEREAQARAAAREREAQAQAAAREREREAEAAARTPVPSSTRVTNTTPLPTQPSTLAANQPPTSVAPATSPATLPPASSPPEQAAVRAVIGDYFQALKARDLALYRRAKPNLSQDEAQAIERSFKAIRDWQIDWAIESVTVAGGSASVVAQRQDTVNGKQQPTQRQVFQLVQRGQAWGIEQIGR